MNLKHILLVALTIFFFNCDSDSDNTVDDIPENNDGTLIMQITYSEPEDDDYIVNFNYNGNRLISFTDNFGSESIYEYTSDQLTRIENYEDQDLAEFVTLQYGTDGELTSFTQFFQDFSPGIDGTAYKHNLQYNSDGTITMEVLSGNFDSQTENSYTTTYFYENNNLIRTETDDFDIVTSYEYDTRNGIYSNIYVIDILEIVTDQLELGFYFTGNSHNVTKFTDVQVSTEIEDYSYTYNENDYPISAVLNVIFEGVVDYSANVEYFYN